MPAGGRVRLTHDSDVMVDKLTTVKAQQSFTTGSGPLSSQQMVELERLMMTFLGMAR